VDTLNGVKAERVHVEGPEPKTFHTLDSSTFFQLRDDPTAIEHLLSFTAPQALINRPQRASTLFSSLGSGARGRLLHRWGIDCDERTFALLYGVLHP
jgi:hypothetical protein